MSSGKVVAVGTDYLACAVTSTVVGDGTTKVIPVNSKVVRLDEAGGNLQHGETGDIYAYTAADPDNQTVTLAAGLPIGKTFAVDDSLYVYPVASDYFASVRQDDVEGEEPIEARVPQELRAFLSNQSKDIGIGDEVELDFGGDEISVSHLYGAEPSLDAGYIDTTFNPIPRTDGLPPTIAPSDLVARGFPRSVLLKHSGVTNADPVTYRYHVTDDNTDIPSDLTVARGQEANPATMAEVDSFQDGSVLLPGVQYYFAAETRDEDVGAGVMGPVSTWVPCVLDPNASSEIAAASITGIHMEAVFLLASEFMTALTGRRVKISNEGFFMYESDDSTLVGFPTTGDALNISADLVGRSITAQNGIDLLGVSRLRAGADLILQSQLANPAMPPTLEIVWPSEELDADALPLQKRGLWWDGTNWSYVVADVGDDPTTTTITIVNTTGGLVSSNPISTPGFIADGGLTKIGTNWYVLGVTTAGVWQVRKYNSSFVQQAVWTYSDEATGKRPAIATDGTNILIARTNSSGSIHVRTYNESTGSNIADVTSSNSPGNIDLAGLVNVSSGEAAGLGFSGARYIVAPRHASGGASDSMFSLNTSGSNQSNESWPIGNGAALSGLSHNGADFFHLSEATSGKGKITKYLTANAWTTENARWWVWYTLYDSVGTVHETSRSPSFSLTMKRRARLQVTVPSIATPVGSDDPTESRVWVGRGSSAPATSAIWLQSGTINAAPWQKNLDAALFTGTAFNVGKAADFPSSTPAEITTEDGTVLFRSDGLPRLRLTKGSTSVSSGTGGGAIGWDTEDIDSVGWWVSGTPNVISPTYNCHALVAADVVWATNGTNLRAMWMEESSNGGSTWSTVPALQSYEGALNNEVTVNRFAQMVPLSSSKIYRVMRYQNSGGALNINSARLTITTFGPQ